MTGRPTYWLIALLLIGVTLAVYWQATGFDFTNYDDNIYVTSNPHINSGITWSSLTWAFTAHCANNWHPLTWVSHTLDFQLNELDPGGHHLTSVVLHVLNVLLLFLVLSLMTGVPLRSAFVAALFAVHPLHAESVAWVAERKDVLSTFFLLLTLLAYIRYVRSPRAITYALVVLAFTLGLLSKPMLVSLPIVLLLLDLWPLGRLQVTGYRLQGQPIAGHKALTTDLRHLLLEKAPLLALALASCVVTYWVQSTTGAVASFEAYPLGVRLANATVACVAYLAKTFWPVGLACFYPHPGAGIPFWQVGGSLAVLVGITLVAIRAGRVRPYLSVGWLWYVITLIPVIGIVQVGKQAMADRYTYLPLIGIFVIVAWGVPDLFAALLKRRKAALAVTSALAVVTLVALSVMAYRQVGYWRNDVSIWTRALAVTKNNAVAHFNLGTTLATQGDNEGAIRQFEAAVKIDPKKFDAHCNLGAMLAEQGKLDEAIKHLRAAVMLKPGDINSQSNLGVALVDRGHYAEAIPHLGAALRAIPGDPACTDALATALQQ